MHFLTSIPFQSSYILVEANVIIQGFYKTPAYRQILIAVSESQALRLTVTPISQVSINHRLDISSVCLVESTSSNTSSTIILIYNASLWTLATTGNPFYWLRPVISSFISNHTMFIHTTHPVIPFKAVLLKVSVSWVPSLIDNK